MEPHTDALTQWAIGKIKTEYPEDVALLVGAKGHTVNGDGHGECFDYFVPATERGNGLAQTFIINGIGYDLYPRTWERLERTADLEDWASQCLGNAVVLYSRSKEDGERFASLQKRMLENLKDSRFVYQKALQNLNIAMDLYRTMMFENKLYQVRMAAGFIHYYLSLGVFCLNGTYPKELSCGRIPELTRLSALPDRFVELYEAMLTAQTQEQLKELAHLSILAARQFFSGYQPKDACAEHNREFQELGNWYEELSLCWRRIRYYCETGNSDAAFQEACILQNELNIIGEEFGLREMDVLSCYDAENLPLLSRKAGETERYIIAEIEKHGVAIKSYASLEEFLSGS